MNNTDKKIFFENIEDNTISNTNYRKVVYTGKMQFVYMSIKPLDDIKLEVHDDHDQFFRIEKGIGQAIIASKTYKLFDGIGFIVPAGVSHQIKNTSDSDELKLYSIYCPPEHPADRLDKENPDKYKQKYLKYKNKYIQLKNI
jgi:mannose-6-phosphate isomerase-like protein (cupin superfamily)